MNDNDEAEQDGLFQIGGPDEDGCVYRGPGGRAPEPRSC
jgi:hypothetical protein